MPAAAQLFEPAQPPREADWVPFWRALYGERLRNTLHRLSEPVFDAPHAKRRFLQYWTHVVSDPDMIGHVLLDNAANYARPALARATLRPLLGNGLLNAEGEDWRRQRRLVAPTFSPGAVNAMAEGMAQSARDQLGEWPSSSGAVDVAAMATRLTARIIARSLFSGDPRLMTTEAEAHIATVIAASGQPRFLRLIGLEALDFSAEMQRVRRARRYLRGSLEALVRERGPGGGADDFFGGLMRAFHAGLPREEADRLAADNAITFYVAGHETTAVALAWSAYLLAAQPELQERLRAEAVTALPGDAAGLPTRAPLLSRFLDEALRLYPPVIQIIREALADDEVCGVPVRKGELVFIYPWIVHRHRRLWDNPDAFDIDRFAPENAARLHRFQFLPFGAGPRICVGMRFAQVEALLIIAHWLAARRFRLPNDCTPMPAGTITMRPRNGMPLLVEPA